MFSLSYILTFLGFPVKSFFLAFFKKRGENSCMDTKEVFSTRVDSAAINALRHLAIDLRKSIGTLLEEAIQDLLKKHESKKTTKKPK